ncbi:MAG: FG-GAP repeat domain-containing protein, partial [Planctomycetota bacterium JB042]
MRRPRIAPILSFPLALAGVALGQDPNFVQPAYPMAGGVLGITARAYLVDLDRDGRLDYVMVGQSQVRTLLGTGSARFTSGEVHSFAAAEVHASAWGDWDGDGLEDLLFEKLHASGSGLTFERMLGDGAGHLVPASQIGRAT